MSSKVYRLLRNNKEVGPFTSEELIQKGLKPFDLIWIDGRSAAWSYPAELSEFKLYVPAPEKQLSGRPLKKSEPSSQVSPSIQAALAVNDSIQTATKQPKPRFKVSAAWSRIQTITVPLYREKMVTPTAEPASSGASGTDIAFQSKPLSWQDAWSDWEKEKNEEKIKAVHVSHPVIPKQPQTVNETFADTPVPETKYYEPLDSVKDRDIENILEQKKRSKAGFSFGKASEFIVPSIALFVILSIGYWLLHDDNKTASALGSAPLQTAQPAGKQANESPANLNANIDRPDNAGITVAKHEEELHPAATEKPGSSNTEQKKTSHGGQTVKSDINAKATSAQKLTGTKPVVTASNVPGTDTKKTGNTSKIFDPAVINNIPKDNSYKDPPSGNAGDLNASENRPVRRRTNNDQETGNQSNLNDQSLNEQAAVNKRANGKANVKYVNVPEYVEMNNGTGSVKVENVSDVDLDLVVVDVQYYDASSRFRKGETLYLHNLKAGRSVVVKTPRDVNSQYAVSKVSLVSADSKGVYIVGDN